MDVFFESRSARRILIYPLITFVLGLTLCLMVDRSFYRQLSWRMSDLLLYRFALQVPHERIAIVGIDSASLSDETGFGQRLTEWDRTIYADLIHYLQAAGARVIVFDILFAGNSKQGDEALAAALRDFPNTVLNVVQSDGMYHMPAAILLATDPTLGHANVIADSDHVIRRVPLVSQSAGETYEALALNALRLFWQLPRNAPLQELDRSRLLPNGLLVPVDAEGNMLINFSPPGAYIAPQCGISTLLQAGAQASQRPHCPDDLFQDKIVFVGATALAARDVHPTPVGIMYGVEIHANVAASLLSGSALQEQTAASKRLVIIGLALLLGVLGMQRRPTTLVIAVSAGTTLFLLLAIVAFRTVHMRVDVAGPLLTFFCAGAAVLAVQNATQRREQREIITLLSMQISPNISRKLLHAYDRNELVLGGELRTITIVFIDMRNYTALAETLPPEQVMHVINTYLDIIATALIGHDGTVSQYVGDQAMALFNAPAEQADHGLLAVRATVAALRAVHEFNHSAAAKETLAEIPLLPSFGAGINTGEAVAGNIGTNDRYNYTVIGDTVNVAARLCGAAPPGAIYLGPQTVAAHPAIRQEFPSLHPIEPLHVKGKAEPLDVYCVEPNREHPIQQ